VQAMSFNSTILSNNASYLLISFDQVPSGKNYKLDLIYPDGVIAYFSASNQITVATNAETTNIQSSYGGGSLLTITGNGFYHGSLSGINKVYVCGNDTQ